MFIIFVKFFDEKIFLDFENYFEILFFCFCFFGIFLTNFQNFADFTTLQKPVSPFFLLHFSIPTYNIRHHLLPPLSQPAKFVIIFHFSNNTHITPHSRYSFITPISNHKHRTALYCCTRALCARARASIPARSHIARLHSHVALAMRTYQYII